MEDQQATSNDGALVLRIIVGGAPNSGKTSTVKSLGEGLGQPTQILEFGADESPQHLDWMEYLGGRHDGKPIHTQLISVSSVGATAMRTSMLQSADVILFVVDTTPKGSTAAISAMAELRRSLADMDIEPPQVIVQANKRDLPDAFAIESLRSNLSIDEDVTVVETTANEGDGVRQAFVFSVRAGLERISRLGANQASAEPVTPEQIIASVEAAEGGDSSRQATEPATAEVEAAEPTPATQAEPDVDVEAELKPEPTESAPAPTPTSEKAEATAPEATVPDAGIPDAAVAGNDGFAVVERDTSATPERRARPTADGGSEPREAKRSTAASKKQKEAIAAKKRRQQANQDERAQSASSKPTGKPGRRTEDPARPATAQDGPPPPTDTHRSDHQPPPPGEDTTTLDEQRPLNKLMSIIKGS